MCDKAFVQWGVWRNRICPDESMAHAIKYSNEAVERLTKLRAFDRTQILDQIEQTLAVGKEESISYIRDWR